MGQQKPLKSGWVANMCHIPLSRLFPRVQLEEYSHVTKEHSLVDIDIELLTVILEILKRKRDVEIETLEADVMSLKKRDVLDNLQP